MRINDDYKEINAEVQMKAESSENLSVWKFWQRALKSRKEHKDVFVYGDFQLLDTDNGKIFAYSRTGAKAGSWVVVLNFTGDALDWKVPESVSIEGWMAGNYTAGKPDKATQGRITLQPWEGLLGKCK